MRDKSHRTHDGCDTLQVATNGVELCGCWMMLGRSDFVCMLPEDHDGDCVPLRSEAMTHAENLESLASEIYDAISTQDALGGWPYEGPQDA